MGDGRRETNRRLISTLVVDECADEAPESITVFYSVVISFLFGVRLYNPVIYSIRAHGSGCGGRGGGRRRPSFSVEMK